MAKQFYFYSGDTTLIPVSDGEYFTKMMDTGASIGACAIEFLDADGETVVTPTGGTATFTSSPIGDQWHTPSNGDGVVNAIDVKPDASYTLPEFNGPVIKSRMVLADVTGASFVRAYHWRDE